MKIIALISTLLIFGCSSNSEQSKTETKALPGKMAEPKTVAEAEVNFTDYNGIGPIKPFTIEGSVNEEMAAKGKETFEQLCTACHKIDKKFIGPSPQKILERRTPSWIMNMILNPEEMLAKDPIAKLLYVENNMSPMANQNLTEEQARAVLEYFRTL